MPAPIPMLSRRGLSALGATLAVLGASLVAGATPARAADFCALTGMDKYVWQGDHVDPNDPNAHTDWNRAQNWDRNAVPGLRSLNVSWNAYVCIPENSVVNLRQGHSAGIQAMDLAANATLTLIKGSKLFLNGDQSTRPSRVRPGAVLKQTGSTIGGWGLLRVDGTLEWTSLPDGAATQTTRECELNDDAVCGSEGPVAHPGRTFVGPSGVLAVNGSGVNLYDKRILENHGLIALTNQGYIAADHGTAIRNQRTTSTAGIVRIANDKGFYEGRARYGLPAATFENRGRLIKSGSTGNGIIGLTYSEGVDGVGVVEVVRGTLSIAGGAPIPASVKQGSGFGSGACAVQGCSTVEVSAQDTQITGVRLPSVGTTRAQVTLEELSGEATPGMMGVPVHVTTANAQATTAQPMIFTLRYHSSVVGTRQVGTIEVLRRADTDTGYTAIPTCVNGALPAGAQSCVDRVSSRKLANGDMRVIVRTTQNSRWMAR